MKDNHLIKEIHALIYKLSECLLMKRYFSKNQHTLCRLFYDF